MLHTPKLTGLCRPLNGFMLIISNFAGRLFCAPGGNTSNINKQLPFHIKVEREHIIIDFYFAYGFHPSADCYLQGFNAGVIYCLAVRIHPQIVTSVSQKPLSMALLLQFTSIRRLLLLPKYVSRMALRLQFTSIRRLLRSTGQTSSATLDLQFTSIRRLLLQYLVFSKCTKHYL